MIESGYFPLFLVGLLGGVHCAGMCGGIVGALSLGSAGPRLPLLLSYNAGRLLAYMLAGTIAGGLGGLGLAISADLPLRLFLHALAHLVLIALGFYLLGFTRMLAFAERLGQKLWRHLQPWTQRFLPVHTSAQAFPLGMLWGWLPCGLVYSALISALSSGSAWQGMALMLSFGLGTLPNLLLAGWFAGSLSRLINRPWLRALAGTGVLLQGIWGLARSWGMLTGSA